MNETISAPEAPAPVRAGDLKANGYAKARTYKNTAVILELLNYLDFLAMNNSCSADDLVLPPITDDFKLDRAAVNALFFGHIEAKKQEDLKNVVLPNEQITKALAKLRANRKADTIDTKRGEIASHLRDYDSYCRNLANIMNACRKLREEIDNIENVEDSSAHIDGMMQALKETNWNFHKYSGEWIEFVHRADLMLRYIEPGAGLRYELNCGKLKVMINLQSMDVKVFGHERYVPQSTSRHCHPHISRENNVCWGNAENTVRDAKLAGDIGTILKILDSLLQTYNEASPYVCIRDFAEHIKRRDELERQRYGQEQAKKATSGASARAEEFDEEEVFDDEPEFIDEEE